MGAIHAPVVMELPQHHPSPLENPNEDLTVGNLSEKRILNLLNTKCTNSFQNLQQAHAIILKSGHFQEHYIAGSLVKCYSNPQFGHLSDILRLLDQILEPNVFVWNCAIKGCMDLKERFAAISIYYKMVNLGSKSNKYTYPPIFKACTIEGAFGEAQQIHCHVIKHGLNADGHIASATIQMYASAGRLREARIMLDSIDRPDIICCNAMINGYMKFGNVAAATKLFENLVEKNVSSWNTMISGFFGNSMIEEAEQYFNRMPVKDEVSWSAMIDGYSKSGRSKEALEVFDQMQREDIKPSKFLFSSLLAACANVGALDQGKWIHAYIRRNRIVMDAVLGTSLVDMYAKCGRIDLAWDAFEKIRQKEVFSWNAMISGLAMHGRAKDAVELFLKMQSYNVQPNDITFIALLNACAHGGFVHEGLKYFVTMKRTYAVEPTIEHYGCIVNLLGKAGYLNEAQNFISSMPMEPNGAVWGALLGACRIHGNVELGEKVGKILLDLEPNNSGRYTLLSNIFAKAGKWDSAEKVRVLMKERGLKTITGTSLINLNGAVHEFKAGDSSHPQIGDITLMLEKILQEIRLKGHQPDTSEVLFDISEEEKETTLKYHSEKLAIAFGILNTKQGSTIRVVKNLRICEDCHSAAKIISQVYDREIIIRDRVRYHHFKLGQCSCKDFW